MSEARNYFEGAFRWIQASSTATLGGTAFSTASAATSALVGFVRAGVSLNSARTMTPIYDRGKPSHFKQTQEDVVELQVTFFDAVTANKPPVNVTAAGATVPAIHAEIKMDTKELGSDSARYVYLVHGVCTQDNWTEADDGNTNQMTYQFLAMHGPTATGYLG
jgi:hypothetical protein